MMSLRLLVLSVLSSTVLANAADKPLWEIGGGVAAFAFPHYLGADESSSYILPAPYFVYRGEYVRADRQGIRGLIYDGNKLDLRLSISGSLPVNSKDNDARDGMDDLDLMLEAGPTLQYVISQSDVDEWRIDIPVRAAFTLGGEFMRHQGWIISPVIQYERDLESGWTVSSSLGPIYTDQRYSAYFYDVDIDDVRADRAYYQSSGGYGGTKLSLGLRKRLGQWFVGTFVRYYDLNNITNENSPLIKKDEYLSGGIFVGYVFAESRRRVNDPDRDSDNDGN